MGFFQKLFGGGRTSSSSSANQLIDELKGALKTGDANREKEVRSLIVREGAAITSALAIAALEFDPIREKDPEDANSFHVARAALGLIGEIGTLDGKNAQALFVRFVRGRSGGEAQREGWGGVWSTAVMTLEKLGYKVVE